MVSTRLVLLVFALVFFVIGSIPYPPVDAYWNRLVSLGLACCVAAYLFG